MTGKGRFVADTNVLVSFLLFARSTPRKAIDKATENGRLLFSMETLRELAEVLARDKFDRYVSREIQGQFLAVLLRDCQLVEPRERIRVCRDPKDDKFLEVAVSGLAKCIITGDADLLLLDPFRGISLLTPQAFLELDF